MSIILSTLHSKRKFYHFRLDNETGEVKYDLLDHLDDFNVTKFESRQSAKDVALQAGLQTWRYVRV